MASGNWHKEKWIHYFSHLALRSGKDGRNRLSCHWVLGQNFWLPSRMQKAEPSLFSHLLYFPCMQQACAFPLPTHRIFRGHCIFAAFSLFLLGFVFIACQDVWAFKRPVDMMANKNKEQWRRGKRVGKGACSWNAREMDFCYCYCRWSRLRILLHYNELRLDQIWSTNGTKRMGNGMGCQNICTQKETFLIAGDFSICVVRHRCILFWKIG